MDVAFYEVFAEEEAALKRRLPSGVRAEFRPGAVRASESSSPPAGLVSIRTQSVLPPAWAGRLKGVLTRSSGFDHLDEFRSRCGSTVRFGCLPDYCARAVAEHALLMVLALARRLKKQMRQMDVFDRDGLTGVECLKRRLLVVGVGHIGRQAAELGRGIGMQVRGVDLVRREPALEYVSLEEGMRWAQAVVCALPLTAATRGLLNGAALRRARPGLIFVNVSRAETSPAQDLRALLEEGFLDGVGLDVYEEEGVWAGHLSGRGGRLTGAGRALLDIRRRDDVIFTPHNAFNTREALERKVCRSVESVLHFLEKGVFPDPVPSGAVPPAGSKGVL